MKIIRVNRKAVDYEKWNQTIDHSINTLPYAYTWYLDSVASDWDAIIVGDYEFVLPLPFKKILGYFKYYKQPFFCQQLGPFGLTQPSGALIESILKHLPQNSIRLNLNLSLETIATDKFKHLNPKQRINQIIYLDQDLDTILSNFKGNQRRAVVSNLHNFGELEEIEAPEKVFNFIKKIHGNSIGLSNKKTTVGIRLFRKAKENRMAKFYQMKNIHSNKIAAMGVVLIDKKRIINLFYSSDKNKENYGAASVYIYRLIALYKSEKKIFDFEGSNIPGIYRFFKSHGALDTYYTSIDRMHPILKLIHKAKMNLRT